MNKPPNDDDAANLAAQTARYKERMRAKVSWWRSPSPQRDFSHHGSRLTRDF